MSRRVESLGTKYLLELKGKVSGREEIKEVEVYNLYTEEDDTPQITYKGEGIYGGYVHTNEELLYDTYEEAKAEYDKYKELSNQYDNKYFLNINTVKEHTEDLIKIQEGIKEGLKGYENFNGIDFCDVSAGGIQIRGFHKEIEGYSYGKQITINYDFSNKNEVVNLFIDMWKEYDKGDKVRREKSFIADGEKYGWD